MGVSMLLRSAFNFHDEPIGFRHPLNPRGGFLFRRSDVNANFVLPVFHLAENFGGIQVQQIAKEIGFVLSLNPIVSRIWRARALMSRGPPPRSVTINGFSRVSSRRLTHPCGRDLRLRSSAT